MVTANSARNEKSAISILRGSKISQMLCMVLSSPLRSADEPRLPRPNQDVGNDGYDGESDEAAHEDPVKGPSLILCESGVHGFLRIGDCLTNPAGHSGLGVDPHTSWWILSQPEGQADPEPARISG